MKIYIGPDYKCHTENGDGRRAFEVPFFDDKCKAFIEGYRFIPPGETWPNPLGVSCSGLSPWRDIDELQAHQAQYETDSADLEGEMLAEFEAAFTEGVNSV